MPGYICAVAICRSNSKYAKNSGEKISFHSFPANKNLEMEWIRRCYRHDKFDPKHKRICSKHFLNEDYEDAVQAKIMGVMPKRLKKQAVPSKNLLPGDLLYEPAKKERGIHEKEHAEDVKFEQLPLSNSILTRETVQDLPGSSSERD